MAREVVTTYKSDLSGKNVPESKLALITVTIGEFSFKADAHQDDDLPANVRGLMEKSRKVSKPGRKAGEAQQDDNNDSTTS